MKFKRFSANNPRAGLVEDEDGKFCLWEDLRKEQMDLIQSLRDLNESKTKAVDYYEQQSLKQKDVIESLRSEVGALRDEKSLLLSAVQMAYQKHHLGLCDIGWEQLGDKLQNTLCEIMGDKAYNAWVCSMEGMDRSPI